MQEYLQHLIPDRNAGYLFPHSLAMGAFGVQKEYHLLKHRPRLTENQHWCKLKGADNIFRVYYTLAGLLKLADLVNTPQAQAFKQALIQHCQAGAIVKSQPAPLYAPLAPLAVPIELYAEPPTSQIFEPNLSSSQSLTPADPAYRLAQYLPGTQVVEQSITSHSPAPTGMVSSGSLSPQELAAIIFKAQQVSSNQIFEAQRLSTENQQSPSEIHVTVNLWDRWSAWLDQQDVFAFSLVAAGMIALMGLSSWLLVASLRTAPASTPGYSTQASKIFD